jgi:hypothetical protein
MTSKTEAQDQVPPAATRGGRGRLRLLLVLVVLGGMLGGIRAVLPTALQKGAEYAAETELGLRLRVENIDLWLWRGAVAIENVRVSPHVASGTVDDSEPALLLKRAFARVSLRDLLDRRLLVHEATFDAPGVRLDLLEDGTVDFLDLAQTADTAEEPSEDDGAALMPWPTRVERLALADAKIRLVEVAEGEVPVQFGVDELVLTDIDITERRIVVDAVELRGPNLRLQRSFALGDDLTAEQRRALGEEAVVVEKEVADAGIDYRVGRVSVEGAGLTLLSEASSLDLDFQVTAAQISPEVGQAFPVRLALRMGEGTLEIEGRFGFNPVAYTGTVRWEDLPLPPVTVATNPEAATWVRSCRARGDVSVDAKWEASDAATEVTRSVRISGQLAVEDLLIEDPEEEEFAFGWKQAEFAVEEFTLDRGGKGSPSKTVLAMDTLRIVEPKVRYTHPSAALQRLQAVLGGGAPPAADEPPKPAMEAGGAVQVSLAALDLNAGELEFVDRSVEPPYRAAVSELQAGASDVRFPERQARQARLSGKVRKRGSFELSGDVQPTTMEAQLQLKRLALPPLSPYAEGASGYRLERGELSLESKLRVDGDRYEADNELELHRLGVSGGGKGRFRGAVGVPLDVALALLRDPDGNIQLSVPLALDAQGVRVDLGEIVGDAVREAVMGAVTSPLKLVGASLDTGEDGDISLEPLRAVSGSGELADGEEDRLLALAGLLRVRLGLGLRLVGRISKKDRRLLAERKLIALVEAGEGLPRVEGERRRVRRRVVQALQERAAGGEGKLDDDGKALLRRYAAAVEVPPEQLADLAGKRARRVVELLVKDYTIDSERLSAADEFVRGRAGVVVELGLPQEPEPEDDPAATM